jgi:fatty acid-binding protein 3
MATNLLGEWKLITSENFDALMKELGVGYVTRKIGNSMKPNLKIEFNQADNTWTLTTTSAIRTHVVGFQLNKEFIEETLDGRKVKSIVSIEDNKMINTQKDDSGKVTCVIKRWVNENGEHITDVKAGNIEAKRVYQKI